MKFGFYPRMAASGIRKNGRLYIPYCITCILMVTVFYIMHFLGNSGILDGMPGGRTSTEILSWGTFVMAFFSAVFLFYTQSTLIKGRKKEFGLYSVLGMNKGNIGRVIFWETVITWCIAIAGGLISGIGLSKLAELGFTRLIAIPVRYTFTIPRESVLTTIIVFSVIFFLIYMNTMRQIFLSRTIDLIYAGKAGEKPPKANWVIGTLGLVLILAGYFIALKIKQPMSALMWFFAAVILVIAGTYLVLSAGSVLLCRLLRKNKDYYYKTDHFVTVSSMAYRMKRNGAGLASICILLTMVLVMLSSTTALYANSEECLDARYPNEVGAFACHYGYDESLTELGEHLDDVLKTVAEERGAAITNNRTYYEWSVSGYLDNSVLQLSLNTMTDMAFIDYDKVAQIHFLDVDVYNRVFGYSEDVTPGHAIVGTAKPSDIGSTLTIGDVVLEVDKRIDEQIVEIDPAAQISVTPSVYVIVSGVEDVASKFTDFSDFNGEPMLAWFWYCRFDTGLAPEEQIELASTLDAALREELAPYNFTNMYCESHEAQRGDYLGTFGGLFFLGSLLSIIFLISCVLIIYYKQISEGFEDQSRFDIMQKVGMTEEDIRKSINTQMLTVFLIPIVLACIHLAVVLPMINKLLMLFGLDDIDGLVLAAAVCAAACAVLYAGIYKLTSNAYYKIVV